MQRTRLGKEQAGYMLMLVPAVVLLILFSIIPMGGLIMAFQNYIPAKGFFGSKWVGMANFSYMFQLPNSLRVLKNTLIIAIAKMIGGLIFPVFFALVLNEIRKDSYKRIVQTIVYMPHFLSWVILGGIFTSMFSLSGIFNTAVAALGMEKVMFMASNTWFRVIIVGTSIWKDFGYGAIIYLAALTAIDTGLYEAASIDGCSRLKQIWHITLPGILPTIVLMATLSLGSILNAGFEQIFTMYNPLVYETGDIIDTYVYRIGLVQLQFSLSTAVGLLKSVVSFTLISLSYVLAKKFSGYSLF